MSQATSTPNIQYGYTVSHTPQQQSNPGSSLQQTSQTPAPGPNQGNPLVAPFASMSLKTQVDQASMRVNSSPLVYVGGYPSM